MAKLTPENVIVHLDEYWERRKELTVETAIDLSFYMDYAISTKDIVLIKAVHNRIIYHLLGY